VSRCAPSYLADESGFPFPVRKSPTGGACTVTPDVADVAMNSTAQRKLIVTVLVRRNANIVNTRLVTADTCAPNPANNTATLTTRRIIK